MLSRAEKILLWSSNISGFGVGMFGPLFAIFTERIGGSILEISWIYALYLCTMGVGMLIVGRYADTVGPEILLVAGRALTAVTAFSYVFVDSLTALFVVQTIAGVAVALREPTWYALYDKHSGTGLHDGYVWGLSTGLWYICTAIAMLLGGYLVAKYSFDVLFITMGCIYTIAAVYQARILQYRV